MIIMWQFLLALKFDGKSEDNIAIVSLCFLMSLCSELFKIVFIETYSFLAD